MAAPQSFEQEILTEFLVESRENLSNLDLGLVELERQPDNAELLGTVFRIFHTLKGTCSFLGFTRMEAVAHLTESILGELRNGERKLDTELTDTILESMDVIRHMLSSIEAGAGEGPVVEEEQLDRLRQLVGRTETPKSFKAAQKSAKRESAPPVALPAVAPSTAAAAPAHPVEASLRVDEDPHAAD